MESNYKRLMRELEDSDPRTRERARNKLVSLGKDVVPALSEAIASGNPTIRWQAARALSQIRDPEIIPALITILEENPYFGVRWSIADGLCGMGKAGLEPLLQSLIKHSGSIWLRESAHHILHCLRDERIETDAIEMVLHALDSIEPEMEVSWAAKRAMELLKDHKRKPTEIHGRIS
jgi:HEAT repeat protein